VTRRLRRDPGCHLTTITEEGDVLFVSALSVLYDVGKSAQHVGHDLLSSVSQENILLVVPENVLPDRVVIVVNVRDDEDSLLVMTSRGLRWVLGDTLRRGILLTESSSWWNMEPKTYLPGGFTTTWSV
jgi:hypothetical protein